MRGCLLVLGVLVGIRDTDVAIKFGGRHCERFSLRIGLMIDGGLV